MITPKQIADELIKLSKIDIFKITRQREYVEVRSLFNYILYNYKKMGYTKIKEFYQSNDWYINHATIIYSVESYQQHKLYNPDLVIWLEHIVDNINKMDNFTKREYIRTKVKSLENKDIDELTMIISNMHDREIELKEKKYITRKYEKQL